MTTVRATGFLTAGLAILSVTGLALAQTQAAPPATATPPAAAAPAAASTAAKPAAKAAGLKHMAGEVVSVSADSKSLTVKHTGKKKAKELTFSLSGDAAAHVGDFKPGDSVRVGYVQEAGKLVAQTVTHGKAAAKK